MPRRKRVDPRKVLLVALYFAHPEKTDSALVREAGYCPNANEQTLSKEAQRQFKDPWVVEQIAECQRRTLARANYSAERVLDGLVNIAEANMRDYRELLFSDDPESMLRCMDPRAAACIEALQVERFDTGKIKKVSIKLYSALDARRMIGNHFGLRLAGQRLISLNPDATVETSGQARAALADLLAEMDRDDLVTFRRLVDRLKDAEQRRLEQTVDGEAEEIDGTGEEESDDVERS